CLRVFRRSLRCLRLWLLFRLLWLLRLCLRLFRRSSRCLRLRLRLGGTGGSLSLGPVISQREDSRQQQCEQQVSAHCFSCLLARLRTSAIHLATSASSGTSRLYAS